MKKSKSEKEFEDLYRIVEGNCALMTEDVGKFYEKGNNAAGSRVRKECMNVIKACKGIRGIIIKEQKKRKKK